MAKLNKESSFIVITNLARVRMIGSSARLLYTGEEFGIPTDEYEQVLKTVQKWDEKLSKVVDEAGY